MSKSLLIRLPKIKNIGAVVALVALLFALRPTLAEEPKNKAPLMPNASFEEINPVTNLPQGWSMAYGRKPICDATVAHDGNRSVRFQFQGPTEDFMILTTIPVKVATAAVCRVSFYIRTLDLEGGYVHIFIYRYPKMEQYNSKQLRGTTDWQKVEVDVPVVPVSDSLQVRVAASASWGEVWFDKGEVTIAEDTK